MRVTLERLFKRPTWVLEEDRALVGCMKAGCDQSIEIDRPQTLEQARDAIKGQEWCFEANNGLHYCPQHAKEFFKMRAERAVAALRRNQKLKGKNPFSPNLEHLFARPTWHPDGHHVVVWCMWEGCHLSIRIDRPQTVEQARDRIKALGWSFETVSGAYYCPEHTREFYQLRADRAAETKKKKKRLLLNSSAPVVFYDQDLRPVPEQKLSPLDREHIAVTKPVSQYDGEPPHYEWALPMPEPAHSPAAARGLRKMFGILDDYFETKRGRYLPGWSDERVAKECDLAVSAVARYREEAYGILRTVDEATLADIRRLDKALADAQAQLDGYREQLASLKAKVLE